MLRTSPSIPLLLGLLLCGGGALHAQAPAPVAAYHDAPHQDAPQQVAPHQDAPLDTAQHQLGEQGLAIEGWDPVAYFPEGGGKPAKGEPAHEVVLHGARYRFASEAHRKLFEANPGRYVPAYGGWCAYAMAQGRKVEVDPESFVVDDGRLMLFYKSLFNDTRADWVKDATLLPRADAAWQQLSGEAPRGDKAAAAHVPHDDEAAAAHDPRDERDERDEKPAAAPSAPGDVGAVVGKHAPDFTLKDAQGVEHSLSSLRGKLVVLDFWATWCGPCKAAMPGVQKLHERFKDKGVVVIGVDGFERSADADPAGYMAGKGYTYTLLLHGEALAESYAIEGLPTFLVIGDDGVVLAREIGKPDDETVLPALLERQIAARAVH
ncbi:MAG TPA: TlpA disulfide reductase family protein [Planctomycetota bacterium]|nr:TlpA disulfide reductase family protein [Planctomycetota bacterium]